MASHGYAKRGELKDGAATYPRDHQFGMQVPVGGSDCAKCEYVNGQKCKNPHFIRWNKSDVIPLDVNKFCCDVFETKEKTK